MAGPIHLFQSVRKCQRMMGIYLTESNELAPFNSKIFLTLFCLWEFFIPTFLFFVFKATTFRDYADCFYAFSSSCASTTHLIVQMVHITNFETLTKKFETFIEQSKKFELLNLSTFIIFSSEYFKWQSQHAKDMLIAWDPIHWIIRFISDVDRRTEYYAKLNKTIDLVTDLLYLSCYLTVVGVICPQIFLSYVNYFCFDLGKESFYLPFQNVYVLISQ